MNTTNLKDVIKKQDIKGSFFKIKRLLMVAFIKRTLLYTKL